MFGRHRNRRCGGLHVVDGPVDDSECAVFDRGKAVQGRGVTFESSLRPGVNHASSFDVAAQHFEGAGGWDFSMGEETRHIGDHAPVRVPCQPSHPQHNTNATVTPTVRARTATASGIRGC